MGRPRKQAREPFWFADRNAWYVAIGTRKHRLSPDKDEAWRIWHELMARKPDAPKEVAPSAHTVVEVVDRFLDWCLKNRNRLTYDAYRQRLQPLIDAIPATLASGDLKPYHLTSVMDAKESWGANRKSDFAGAVNRAYNWAIRQVIIDRNPVENVEKPAREVRELTISPADYAEVMGKVTEPNFRLLLELAWETGARPQELRKIEARYFDAANHRIVFPPREAKGKKYHRVIYLGSDRARQLVADQAALFAEGPILRNSEGNPWKKDAINCAFCRLQKKIGKKLHLGAWRKGYATEALKAGIDLLSVAHLLGHRDGAMISKVYGRVQNDPAHMADMAKRAKKPQEP